MFQSFTIVLGVLFCFVNGDVINYDNIRRFMSQSPDDLAKTLQLLENPYIAAALVNSNKKQQKEPAKTYPMEESNNLLNFLLSQRIGDSSRTNYKIENPSLALVPPIVNAKGIEEDPLLGSFFKDTMEDQTPLEVSDIMLIYDGLFIHCSCWVTLAVYFYCN